MIELENDFHEAYFKTRITVNVTVITIQNTPPANIENSAVCLALAEYFSASELALSSVHFRTCTTGRKLSLATSLERTQLIL